jgi:hypothetical protein
MTDDFPFAALLATPEPPDLGPGPRVGVKTQAQLDGELRRFSTSSALTPQSRELVRALVLLWHDHQDAAHEISQGIENADGSFVHGIVHRREPDYGNAEYWFRRVGKHAAFPEIAKRVRALSGSGDGAALVSTLMANGNWDPFAFIHACAQASAAKRSKDAAFLREVQRIESEVLLEYFCGR